MTLGLSKIAVKHSDIVSLTSFVFFDLRFELVFDFNFEGDISKVANLANLFINNKVNQVSSIVTDAYNVHVLRAEQYFVVGFFCTTSAKKPSKLLLFYYNSLFSNLIQHNLSEIVKNKALYVYKILFQNLFAKVGQSFFNSIFSTFDNFQPNAEKGLEFVNFYVYDLDTKVELLNNKFLTGKSSLIISPEIKEIIVNAGQQLKQSFDDALDTNSAEKDHTATICLAGCFPKRVLLVSFIPLLKGIVIVNDFLSIHLSQSKNYLPKQIIVTYGDYFKLTRLCEILVEILVSRSKQQVNYYNENMEQYLIADFPERLNSYIATNIEADEGTLVSECSKIILLRAKLFETESSHFLSFPYQLYLKEYTMSVYSLSLTKTSKSKNKMSSIKEISEIGRRKNKLDSSLDDVIFDGTSNNPNQVSSIDGSSFSVLKFFNETQINRKARQRERTFKIKKTKLSLEEDGNMKSDKSNSILKSAISLK